MRFGLFSLSPPPPLSYIYLNIHDVHSLVLQEHEKYIYIYSLMILYKWFSRMGNVECLDTRFGNFVDRIYPIELEINDTTDTDRSATYLDLHIEIDSECG